MPQPRIEWNDEALYDVRRDPNLIELERETAQRICDEANRIGSGTFMVGSRQGERRPEGRWRTTVYTADAKAMASNARHNVLIRAMS
ncbi:hypothetical protein [Williamsia deligens]|uniref:Uncharacterized protein n=1 Tax=Williamsia deligens TaxID=321325 RepID=A0ABW3GHQ1_9NOCA|nr:hypothetical protein [Williamsia deligens]MCP2196287.1 hypothetical protein [Williamsia deligens]